MSQHGRRLPPPPLPPRRSPRPPEYTYPQQPQYVSPPPPPVSAPGNSGTSLAPVGAPPPIPPRPPGFEVRNRLGGGSAPPIYSPYGETHLSVPQPPPSPDHPPPETVSSGNVTLDAQYQSQPPRWHNTHPAILQPGPPSPTTWSNHSPLSPSSPHSPLPGGFSQYPAPLSPLNPSGRHSNSPRLHSPVGQVQTQPYSPVTTQPNHHRRTHSNTLPSYLPHTRRSPSPHLQIPYGPREPPLPDYAQFPIPYGGRSQASGTQSPITTSHQNSQAFHWVADAAPAPLFSPVEDQSLETSFQSLKLKSPKPSPSHSPRDFYQTGTTSFAVELPGCPVPVLKHNNNPSTKPQAQAFPIYEMSGESSYFPASEPPPVKSTIPHETKPPEISHASPRVEGPKAVTACIDIPMSFPTDWYWHPEASEYMICSRCYVDHIHGTSFEPHFKHQSFDDGKSRSCRFNKPRMKEHEIREARASGSLANMVAAMRTRSTIPDCKGTGGVKGTEGSGLRWYAIQSNQVPNFLACEACYEDYIIGNRFANQFTPFLQQQSEDAIWACDMAISYIREDIAEKAKHNAWASFTAEAKARLAFPWCSDRETVTTAGRKWFAPKQRIPGLVLCVACYCDQIGHSDEASKWELATELVRDKRAQVRCAVGMFNIRVLLAQAHERKDWAIFWRAIGKMNREKPCADDGIVDGTWYTLPSNPREFGVCGACHAAILEPLNISHLWKRKTGIPAGTKALCCFNFNHPRFGQYIPRLLEMYFTLDPTTLDSYASVYACIPPCSRDLERTSGRWYGWRECLICPDCYHTFAKQGTLANSMELRDAPLADSTVCEMYSARMRDLYTECGAENNLGKLLQFSEKRRQVYFETVPKMRAMIADARAKLNQQRYLNTMSSYHNTVGMLDQISYGTRVSYSAPGLGCFATMDGLKGAAYSQQAMSVMAGVVGSGALAAVQTLEQRWRAVE
ncbi:hypothetical protein F5Y18DRAFT_133852 [Xylariaceae sp. FL1019]|nr:hypothetical protein F5Y18DRAFT_133852 [Xylariaceae sp. FL1019]